MDFMVPLQHLARPDVFTIGGNNANFCKLADTSCQQPLGVTATVCCVGRRHKPPAAPSICAHPAGQQQESDSE